MDPTETYEIAYRIIGKNTPLGKLDCGKLCGHACCLGDRHTGMLLFPQEEKLFADGLDQSFTLHPSPFSYGNGKRALLLVCSGKCKREIRPLSCRIFPLVPYKSAPASYCPILDPRARRLCPLAAANDRKLFNPEFITAVQRLFRYLALFPQIRPFLDALSKEAEEYLRFYA